MPGKQPDFIIESTNGHYIKNNKNKVKKLHFEYLVGEIANSPFKETIQKTTRDKYKSFKLMKDSYDAM